MRIAEGSQRNERSDVIISWDASRRLLPGSRLKHEKCSRALRNAKSRMSEKRQPGCRTPKGFGNLVSRSAFVVTEEETRKNEPV